MIVVSTAVVASFLNLTADALRTWCNRLTDQLAVGTLAELLATARTGDASAGARA